MKMLFHVLNIVEKANQIVYPIENWEHMTLYDMTLIDHKDFFLFL